MKNRVYGLLLSSIVLGFSSFFAFRTTAFFSVSAVSEPMEITVGEWQPATSSVVGMRNGVEYSLAQILEPSSLHQDFVSDDNYMLSFLYMITSDENLSGFDMPNFLVKINDEVGYQDKTEVGVWYRGYIDLRKYGSEDGEYSLDFLANNTFDDEYKPTVEVKEVSSSRFLAKRGDVLKFSLSKDNAEMHVKYSVLESGEIVEKQDILQAPFEFTVTKELASDVLEYFSVDEFDNIEESRYLKVATDFTPPTTLEIEEVSSEGDGEISLVFSFNGDDFISPLASYSFRVADEVVTEDSWDSATPLTLLQFKEFINTTIPLQLTSFSDNWSSLERQQVVVLKSEIRGEKYLAVRVSDLAGNISGISSSVLVEIKD